MHTNSLAVVAVVMCGVILMITRAKADAAQGANGGCPDGGCNQACAAWDGRPGAIEHRPIARRTLPRPVLPLPSHRCASDCHDCVPGHRMQRLIGTHTCASVHDCCPPVHACERDARGKTVRYTTDCGTALSARTMSVLAMPMHLHDTRRTVLASPMACLQSRRPMPF